MSWQCPACGHRNPNSTLACEKCGQVDVNATPEELGAWNKVVRAERGARGRRVAMLAAYLAITLWAVWTALKSVARVELQDLSAAEYHNAVNNPNPSEEGTRQPVSVSLRITHIRRDVLSFRHFRAPGRSRIVSRTYELASSAGDRYAVDVTNDDTDLRRGDAVDAVLWEGEVIIIASGSRRIETDDYPDTKLADARTMMTFELIGCCLLVTGGLRGLWKHAGRSVGKEVSH